MLSETLKKEHDEKKAAMEHKKEREAKLRKKREVEQMAAKHHQAALDVV